MPDIPRRLLLDNLSDEEEQVPDDIKREKCHFFQDLLLSTLTEQKLTMKVSGKLSHHSNVMLYLDFKFDSVGTFVTILVRSISSQELTRNYQ